MSIPLSPYRYFTEESDESRHVKDIFLDTDERYEIYEVKSAERRHLIYFNDEQESSTGSISCFSSSNGNDNITGESHKEEKLEYVEHAPKPLIDGCDIPGWRKEKLVAPHITPDKQAILNIGASSTMFRRERQWPFHTTHGQARHGVGGTNNDHDCKSNLWLNMNMLRVSESDSPWIVMRRALSLSSNIRRGADIIHHDEYKKLVPITKGKGDTFSTGSSVKMATKFAIEYEQKNIPAVILGATKGWKCMPLLSRPSHAEEYREDAMPCDISRLDMFSGGSVGGWTFSNLLTRFRHVYWRFSDTHGEMMSFGTYAKYITNLEGLLDDSPLGIYDSEFGDDDSPTHELLEEYDVPSCFSPDLFDLAVSGMDVNSSSNNDKPHTAVTRPPYRWILIGPERSGTGMHIDPLWTNAWVTVLQGKKRWMLFPPQVPLVEIGMVEGEPQINSATWFKNYYDKVVSDEWPEEWRPVEVLQDPGETVFVPNGWPHLVLNLDLTVAVTHNYASEFGPFERMWEEVSKDEPDFAERWIEGMKNNRSDLVERLQQDQQLLDK